MNHAKNWYVLYTRPRTEKKIAESFAKQGIEHYLPLIKELKQWSDRKKWVEEPVFKSYIFVHIHFTTEYLTILKTPFVGGFVSFSNQASIVPTNEIETIKTLIQHGEIKVTDKIPDFNIGDLVEITEGPLKNIQGTLIKEGKKNNLYIHINCIEKNIIVTINHSALKKIKEKNS